MNWTLHLSRAELPWYISYSVSIWSVKSTIHITNHNDTDNHFVLSVDTFIFQLQLLLNTSPPTDKKSFSIFESKGFLDPGRVLKDFFPPDYTSHRCLTMSMNPTYTIYDKQSMVDPILEEYHLWSRLCVDYSSRHMSPDSSTDPTVYEYGEDCWQYILLYTDTDCDSANDGSDCRFLLQIV